jgi:hypothetical protein
MQEKKKKQKDEEKSLEASSMKVKKSGVNDH